jgi:hypothetical protein
MVELPISTHGFHVHIFKIVITPNLHKTRIEVYLDLCMTSTRSQNYTYKVVVEYGAQTFEVVVVVVFLSPQVHIF